LCGRQRQSRCDQTEGESGELHGEIQLKMRAWTCT
jgi:hypothetical protein